MYLIAILCPPVAVLLCGKPMQAGLCFILSLAFYVPGLIYACAIVGEHKADRRMASACGGCGVLEKPRE